MKPRGAAKGEDVSQPVEVNARTLLSSFISDPAGQSPPIKEMFSPEHDAYALAFPYVHAQRR